MKQWIGLVLRLVVGGVWIAAAVVKLPDPAQSVAAVRAYQLLPSSVVPTVGQLLPVVELVVGICLVVGLLTRGAAVVSALLFLAFIIGISSAWARIAWVTWTLTASKSVSVSTALTTAAAIAACAAACSSVGAACVS